MMMPSTCRRRSACCSAEGSPDEKGLARPAPARKRHDLVAGRRDEETEAPSAERALSKAMALSLWRGGRDFVLLARKMSSTRMSVGKK